MFDNETVYSAGQVAKAYGISVPTLIRLLKKGELKGRQIGTQWKILGVDANEYWDSGTPKPGN